MTTGSGMPFTPVYIQGTALSSRARQSHRRDITSPNGYYLNPAAYSLPAADLRRGRTKFGARAGTFTMNGSLQRSFPRGRLNFDLRIDVTNLLNRVTYTTSAIGLKTRNSVCRLAPSRCARSTRA